MLLRYIGWQTFLSLTEQEAHERQIAGTDEEMTNALLVTSAVALVSAAIFATLWADEPKHDIVGLAPEQLRWFTPPYYTDGRQRARLFGDSSQGGTWVDRVKIPANKRVLAHTHPHDELVTVIEGIWYVGRGESFDPAKLKSYPAGSFIAIPAGVPHFVAARERAVVVQLSGTGKFGTDYLPK